MVLVGRPFPGPVSRGLFPLVSSSVFPLVVISAAAAVVVIIPVGLSGIATCVLLAACSVALWVVPVMVIAPRLVVVVVGGGLGFRSRLNTRLRKAISVFSWAVSFDLRSASVCSVVFPVSSDPFY